MSGYREICPHCGAVKATYVHCLNRSLVDALRQIVDYYAAANAEANLQDDLALTKNQYNNFQKLQYFGLVKRIRSGWFPTSLGIDFIENNCMVYDRVMTFGDNVIGPDNVMWSNYHIKPKLVYSNDVINEDRYKQRSEYQKEKSSQLSLDDESAWEAEQGEKAKWDFFEQSRGV